MSGDKPVKRAGKRPGRKPSKMDVKAKLERSRQSARECRARKKLRYQYLEELVASREKAIFSLREELEMSKRMCMQLDKGVIPEALVKLLASRRAQSAGRQPQGQAPRGYAPQRTYSQTSGAARFGASSSSTQQLPSVISAYQPSASRSLFSHNSFPPTVYSDSVQPQPYLSMGGADSTGISGVHQDLSVTTPRGALGTNWMDSLQSGATVTASGGSPFSGGLSTAVGGSSVGGGGWVDYSPASTIGTLQSAGSSSNLSTASWASSVSEGCSVTTPFTSSTDSQGFSCGAPSASGNVAPTNVSLTSMSFQAMPSASVLTGDAGLDSILNYLTEDAPLPGVSQGDDMSSLQFERVQPQVSATTSTSEGGGFGSTSVAGSTGGAPSGNDLTVEELTEAGNLDQSLLEALQVVLTAAPSVSSSTPHVTYAPLLPESSGTGESSSEVVTSLPDAQIPSWMASWKD